MEDKMLSDEYWKDKTIDKRQVVSAWILVGLLAVGAYYTQALARSVSCATSGSTRAASLTDSRDNIGVRARDLR